MKKINKQQFWTPIIGFETYYHITRLGIIKSLHRRNKKGKISYRVDRAGYLTVRLSKDGKSQTKYLHRILAETFIPNPESKPGVNHIDGNKANNSLLNLEWVSHGENILHAYQIGLIKKKSKPVIDIVTGEKFNSLREACKIRSLNYNTMRNRLSGNIKKNPTCLQYQKTG